MHRFNHGNDNPILNDALLQEAYQKGYRQALNEQGTIGGSNQPFGGLWADRPKPMDDNIPPGGGPSRSTWPGGTRGPKGKRKPTMNAIPPIEQRCDENGENCRWWCGTQFLDCDPIGNCVWSESGCSEAEGPCGCQTSWPPCGQGGGDWNPPAGGDW